jgi:hypothetical protein
LIQLAAGVWPEATQSSTHTAEDLHELIRLAHRYGVLATIGTVLQKSGKINQLPAPVLDELFRRQINLDLTSGAEYEASVMVQIAVRQTELHVRSLMNTLDGVLTLFTNAGIRAAPLKGAHMTRAGWFEPGARQMRDLDVLVERKDAQRAHELLLANGFVVVPIELRAAVRASHHLPPLVPPSGVGSIELHHELVIPQWTRVLPASQVWARASPDSVLHEADMIAHLIVHDFGSDAGWHARSLPIRSVIDVNARAQFSAQAIDWPSVAHRFDDGRARPLFDAWLANATKLGAPFAADAIDQLGLPSRRALVHAWQSEALSQAPQFSDNLNRLMRRTGVLQRDQIAHQFDNAYGPNAARVRYSTEWLRRRYKT